MMNEKTASADSNKAFSQSKIVLVISIISRSKLRKTRFCSKSIRRTTIHAAQSENKLSPGLGLLLIVLEFSASKIMKNDILIA